MTQKSCIDKSHLDLAGGNTSSERHYDNLELCAHAKCKFKEVDQLKLQEIMTWQDALCLGAFAWQSDLHEG